MMANEHDMTMRDATQHVMSVNFAATERLCAFIAAVISRRVWARAWRAILAISSNQGLDYLRKL